MGPYTNLGNGFMRGADGQVYTMPMPVSADSMMARPHALGAFGADDPRLPPQSHPVYMGPGIENDPQWNKFTKVPQWYVASVLLNYPDGSIGADSVPLRPEPFICKRITWACTGDVSPNVDTGTVNLSGGSAQGRSVLVEWSDEFTNFMGSRPALISALFGDSQGYLDLQRGLLFQGKQTLGVKLTRLFYPTAQSPDVVRFDFIFHGIGLLPLGVNQSGSAG